MHRFHHVSNWTNVKNSIYFFWISIFEKNILNDKIEYYPNPVDDYIYFKGDDLRYISTLKIYDMSGKLVYQKESPFLSANYIDVQKLKSGYYIINFDQTSIKIIMLTNKLRYNEISSLKSIWRNNWYAQLNIFTIYFVNIFFQCKRFQMEKEMLNK